MNRRILTAVAFLLICLADNLLAADMPIQQMDDSTVRVIARHSDATGTGSGFVIGGGRYIVTNHHVIEDADEIDVYAKLFKSRVARVVVDSPEKDLAVLELAENIGRPGVVLGLKSGVHKTQPVLVAGFPAAADQAGSTRDDLLDVKFTQGIISGLLRGEKGAALYEVSAAVNPGNSGGPLFDECGRVIGINVAKSLIKAYVVGPDGQPAIERVPLGEGIAWSIQSDELLALLQSQSIPIEAQATACNPVTHTEVQPVSVVPVPASNAFVPDTVPVATAKKPLTYRLTPPITGGLIALAIIVLVVVVLLVRSLDRHPTPKPIAPPLQPPILPPPPPNPRFDRLREDTLRGISGPHAGMDFPISESPLALGRDPSQSQIVFNKTDALVGRRHCTVRFDGARGGVVLEDCGSVNGTFLEDGERLRSGEPRLLRSNGRFYLGSRDYMFQVK